ncbi:hypothetical protein AYI70_g9307 [Smittium culicis]|uniref:Uncharacterized protein n=1 Tax=Smittium culicis TaxID=133412 RepID=A0A1R1XBV5_9FUNG|nr:hypothetical protein AYI70_g9307 [Smittium culicis]
MGVESYIFHCSQLWRTITCINKWNIKFLPEIAHLNMEALSEITSMFFNPFLMTLCRLLDLSLNIPRVSTTIFILASNTPRKKRNLEAIALVLGCSNAPPADRAPHFEMPKEISLSFFHFSKIRRFSLRPTSESASNTRSSASRIPGILTLFPGINAKFSLTLSKISLIKIPNSMGNIGQPCITPLSTFKNGDIKLSILNPASDEL